MIETLIIFQVSSIWVDLWQNPIHCIDNLIAIKPEINRMVVCPDHHDDNKQ
jgi:hypothetical protein